MPSDLCVCRVGTPPARYNIMGLVFNPPAAGAGSVVIPRFPLAATSFANMMESETLPPGVRGGAPAHRRPCHTRPKLTPVRCTTQLGEGS